MFLIIDVLLVIFGGAAGFLMRSLFDDEPSAEEQDAADHKFMGFIGRGHETKTD